MDLFFDEQGNYSGFDEQNRLTQNRGKIEVVQDLAGQGKRTVFVGDGVTDLEAGETVDLFIGFGGVVRRPEVEKKAKYYITCPSLAGILPILLTPYEQGKLQQHPQFQNLMKKAAAV